MLTRPSRPRTLQQQPRRDGDMRQQQAGTSDFQPQGGASQQPQQMGAGSHYQGTRNVQKRTDQYLEHTDADASAAKPRSEQESRGMMVAEKEAKPHAKSGVS